MNFEMSFQSITPSKRSVTLCACKRQFSGMTSHVSGEAIILRELSFTSFTFIQFNASMHTRDVPLQYLLCCITFSTKIAISSLFTRMTSLVSH